MHIYIDSSQQASAIRILTVVDNPNKPGLLVPLKFWLWGWTQFFLSTSHFAYFLLSWIWLPDLLAARTWRRFILTLGASRWDQLTASQSSDFFWPLSIMATIQLPWGWVSTLITHHPPQSIASTAPFHCCVSLWRSLGSHQASIGSSHPSHTASQVSRKKHWCHLPLLHCGPCLCLPHGLQFLFQILAGSLLGPLTLASLHQIVRFWPVDSKYTRGYFCDTHHFPSCQKSNNYYMTVILCVGNTAVNKMDKVPAHKSFWFNSRSQ